MPTLPNFGGYFIIRGDNSNAPVGNQVVLLGAPPEFGTLVDYQLPPANMNNEREATIPLTLPAGTNRTIVLVTTTVAKDGSFPGTYAFPSKITYGDTNITSPNAARSFFGQSAGSSQGLFYVGVLPETVAFQDNNLRLIFGGLDFTQVDIDYTVYVFEGVNNAALLQAWNNSDATFGNFFDINNGIVNNVGRDEFDRDAVSLGIVQMDTTVNFPSPFDFSTSAIGPRARIRFEVVAPPTGGNIVMTITGSLDGSPVTDTVTLTGTGVFVGTQLFDIVNTIGATTNPDADCTAYVGVDSGIQPPAPYTDNISTTLPANSKVFTIAYTDQWAAAPDLTVSGQTFTNITQWSRTFDAPTTPPTQSTLRVRTQIFDVPSGGTPSFTVNGRTTAVQYYEALPDQRIAFWALGGVGLALPTAP